MMQKGQSHTLLKKLEMPVSDIIRWKDKKFIDHIENSIFK